MKKVIFFSLEDGWLGGVASVNLALEEALSARGYQVEHLFLRGCLFPLEEKENAKTIRKKCPWNMKTGQEMKKALSEKKIFLALSLLGKRLLDEGRNFIDRKKARAYLEKANPDLLVVSGYLLLPFVPPRLYSRTLHHVHTSFDATMKQAANAEMLRRYNGKIGFLWLSEAICKKAEEEGFSPSFYAYNPLSSYPEEKTDAARNKTILVITRFSPEKRLPLAVELLRKAMDRLPDPNAFSVEFYGTGPEEEALLNAIGDDPRFHLCGQTKNPFALLKKARFTVNTSTHEGFSISLLESAAAGVPALSFRFGEAAEEEIINGKTGILVPMDDTESFAIEAENLMKNDSLVEALSQGAREHAASFTKEEIGGAWEQLLSLLPLDKK